MLTTPMAQRIESCQIEQLILNRLEATRKELLSLALFVLLLASFGSPVTAQNPPAGAIRVGSTQVQNATNGNCLTDNGSTLGQTPCGTGSALTALTGDVTATGPGSAVATVVQVEGGAIPANAGALGTNSLGQLVSVTPGGGTTPGYPANQPVSGCGVEYVSGLTFTVGACTYTIGGTQYTSALTSITLAAADPSNPRIGVIIVDNTGTASAITGTPAASPAQPTVDYSTQLPLNLVLVNANATTPSAITATLIYDENTEWTCSSSAHINCASTNNPYHGTKDIEATTAVSGNNFTLVKPAAGTVDLSTQSTLTFYIRSKAQWPAGSGNGANGLRTLSLFWLNGSTQIGVQVVLKDGAFGFASSLTTGYQQISIPLGLFGTGSNLVTTLEAQVTGNGGSSSFGWYIDEVSLQAGTTTLSLPATLMNFKGVWNSTTNYNVNDVVVSSGTGYVALKANTNIAVTTASTWAAVAVIPNTTGCTNQFVRTLNGASAPTCASVGTNDIAANAVGASQQSVATTYRSCVISNDTQSGTALTAAQFSGNGCAVPAASTIVEVDVTGGTGTLTGSAAAPTYTGTSSVQIGKTGSSSSTGLLSGALATVSGKACAKTSTSASCILNGVTSSSSITVSTTALGAGDELYVTAATPDTTQTWYAVTIIYTVN